MLSYIVAYQTGSLVCDKGSTFQLFFSEGQIMKVMKNLAHVIMMACSLRNHRAMVTLADLQEQIARCRHQKADMKLIRSLVQMIQNLNQERLGEAIELLVEANNFECKAYAIELDSTKGKICGDQLMETVRDDLGLCGHGDRATWVRKKLILARKWYRISGALTQSLADEINAGLDRTKWVLQMWPDYMEIVDPEGH